MHNEKDSINWFKFIFIKFKPNSDVADYIDIEQYGESSLVESWLLR